MTWRTAEALRSDEAITTQFLNKFFVPCYAGPGDVDVCDWDAFKEFLHDEFNNTCVQHLTAQFDDMLMTAVDEFKNQG